ncbi:MAG: RsmD family RNA methyltransferase [Alistipes sp.]
MSGRGTETARRCAFFRQVVCVSCGKYRGRTIDPPPNLGARPTTDFAKETCSTSCRTAWITLPATLDLFAGTGSISCNSPRGASERRPWNQPPSITASSGRRPQPGHQ